jgi:hypothetical protein
LPGPFTGRGTGTWREQQVHFSRSYRESADVCNALPQRTQKKWTLDMVEKSGQFEKKNFPLSLTRRSCQPISGSQAENLTTIYWGFSEKGSFRASSTA